jgi:prophage regulatory protein
MIDRFIRLPEVIKAVGLCKPTIYVKISAGEFPEPIKLGRVSVWLQSEISAWIDERVSEYRKAS